MKLDQIQLEREAIQSLSELYEKAMACHELYERAHLALPESLKRFLGIHESRGEVTPEKIFKQSHVPPPNEPSRPAEASDDWIYIRTRDASVNSLVLAFLRSSNGPLRPREISELISRANPEAASGSVANAGTRLQADNSIERTDEGWRLLRPEIAGVVSGDFLWARPSTLSKQDVAAHRRDAILHLLSQFPSGLQVVQIVEQLRLCPWVQAPSSKDLLKADMEVLESRGLVRQRGNSRKWELVPAGEEFR
jgi:hypothetical protein